MKKLLNFFRLWPDIFGFPLALLVFFVSPFFLHKIDPTSKGYDIGIFQIILFGVIAMLALNSLTWLGIRFNFRFLFRYYVEELPNDFFQLNPIQRICVLLSVYFGLLLALVLSVRVL